MALSTNATTKVTQLYVAMFGRAPDMEGLNFWGGALDAGQSVAQVAQAMFGTTPARAYFPEGSTSQQIVQSFYVNVLGRQPDAGGLEFWVARLDALKAAGNTNAVGQLVTEIVNIVTNYTGNDSAGLASAQLFANKIEVANFWAAENGGADNATKPIALVTADPASVNQVKAQILNGFGDIVANTTFTLKEVVVEGQAGTPPVTAMYWGYNPNSTENDNSTEGPSDGGVPVAEMLKFLTTITGLDLHELGLIDDDGVGPFDNVTNLTISNALSMSNSAENAQSTSGSGGNDNSGQSPSLQIEYADGTFREFNIEAQIAESYFKFLNDLLFDSEGNSRLYEKVIVPGTSGSSDSLAPIKLTPSVNNGGTFEQGYTTAGDDLIVAGRLELLHGAYIDGGAGRNVLEVDAKGEFAQPVELLNIQEVRVHNLPNFYTVDNGEYVDGDPAHGYLDNSAYPYLSGSGSRDSFLDLSRATSIEKLVVTEGNAIGLDIPGSELGDLTIVGVRNGATLRLEGGFERDVTVHYGQGLTGPLTVELLLGQVTGKLNFVHNTDALHLVSLGGVANSFGSEDIGGRLTNLKISGDAALYINGDLDNSFQDETPVTIDASANTKGVDLKLTNSEKVTFIGSAGNDSFKVSTDDAVDVVGAGNSDDSVTIVGGAGNNHFEVDSTTINVTVADGQNNIELEGQFATVVAGNGNNTVVVDEDAAFETISVTVGNGNNAINTDDSETVNIVAGNGKNVISSVRGESVTIEAGNGGNNITVSAEEISITTGTGNDTITVSGMGGTDIGGDANTTALLNIDTGAGNNTVVLGRDLTQQVQFGITALEGSSITGDNITLRVENLSDLRAAQLDGITRVVLNYDISTPINSNVQGYDLDPVLTLTDTQFLAIGAANFAVQGAVFSNYAQIKIIVTSSTSLTALGVDSLPRNLDLQLELQDGVTLTMTAQQLHTKVAPNGITLDGDNNTDAANGKVIITGGGVNFDPFNNSDTIKTNIDGTVYYGGSLSDDFKVDGKWYNVTVKSLVNGWDRPADVPAEVVITLDSTGTAPLEQGAFSSWHTNLAIVGDQDINFTGDIQLGMQKVGATMVPTNPFTIDFSELEGVVNNFVVDNFELLAQGGGIFGNSNNGYASEVHISLAKDTSGDDKGFDEADAQSLVSTGVTKYVVTTIDGPTANGSAGNTATVKLCDTVQDLEVFALRGNYNDTLVVQDAAWGLVFELQGGGTAKSEGPTGTSNVGSLIANYEWEHADAVVNIVHSVAGDVRPIHVEKIDIDNADTLSIDVAGSAVIDTLVTQDATSLDVDATGNVAFVDSLALGTLDTIDASGVVGTFAATLSGAASGDDDFSFEGSTGGSSLTLLGFAADNGAADGTTTTIDGGVGGVTLTIGNGTAAGNDTVDLSAATLTNVSAVVLTQGSSLTLTIAQAGVIGAAGFSTPGTDTATLNLTNLDSTLFVRPAFASDITVAVVSIAPLPEVTLNAGTNLTGISGLAVHEGTTLNLTAAQFQQLTGNGTISLIANPAITADTVINITGLTAADVAAGFSLADVAGALVVNLQLAESVDLSAANLTGVDSITFGDGVTLTLGDVQQADGVDIVGGANSVLKFTDTAAGAFESIDASGFDVTELHMLNVLVDNRNIDLLFSGLAQSITKVIYNDLGWVEGVTQTVAITAGTTVPGFVVFNKPEDSVEIRNFVLNLQGGTEINGNLRLSSSIKDGDLIQTHLQSVVINSTGTGANLLTGSTANVIDGDITSQGTGNQGTYTSVDNNLLNITINAEQALTVTGEVVFESVTGDDAVTANDDDAAIAELTVNGTASVNLGGLNTQDDDVDGLVVTNAGTGTLSVTVDGSAIDQDVAGGNNDALSFLGGNIQLTIVNGVNLSDDVITGVSKITLTDATTTVLTLTQAQFGTLGAANLVATNTNAGQISTLNLVAFGTAPFDATTVDADINVGTLTLVPGTVTLDPATNLTGVDAIIVQDGGVLNLTAAQFQQLQGAGAINAANALHNFTVNITGLTQADVNAGFSLAAIGTLGNATITLTLAEDVNLIGADTDPTANDNTTVLGNLDDLTVILAAGQTIGLGNETQADGLNVNGGANSTIVFQYAPHTTYPGQIDASGYNVTTLKALAAGFTTGGNSNVEYSIDDLPSSVELRLYEDPADLGFLDPTFRRVVIEEGITTPTGLIFSDWDAGDEVRTLHLTLAGDVVLNGSLSIPTRTDKDGSLTQRYFDALTIVSEGAKTNTINGNINTATVLAGPNTSNNNLLSVTIEATQNLVLTGAGTGLGNVVFSYNPASNLPAAAQVANFVIEGSANVTVDALDVSDGDIAALAVANNGSGVLTVTGGSPAIFDNVAGPVGNAGANLETLTFSGTGDIVIGDANLVSSPYGIDLGNLSTIDASGLTGNLSLGEIKNIDSADFSFIAGTGVTKVTLSTDSLDSTGVDTTPGNTDDTAGWSFDFSNAAAGSELHLANLGALTAGSKLTIDMGANGTLYIDGPGTVDLSDLVLDINQVQAIVLADGVTLQLTAAQANGLDIIAGPDTGTAGITAKVNIVDLTNDTDPDNPVDAFDLSGIAQNIAGTITFKAGVNDVTLDKATDLGFFSVTLDTLTDDTSVLTGQTIRFQNVAQAERVVIAANDATPATGNSSNVVWLFDNITAPVNTRGYFSTGALDPLNPYATAYTIGRLWLSEELINNEGGDVEQLFTTLPHSILRVDFTDITALNVLLGSAAVNRVVELVHFTNLNDLTFSDVGLNPVEHLASLNLQLGGQVTIGNINLNDVVGAPGYDPATVNFTALTIESHLAQHQDHYLATEAYVNDNDGVDEVGEFARPNAINTIGNISVGAGLDLLTVNIDTLDVAAAGVDPNGGAAINIGTITYGARTPATPAVLTATLDVTGDNDVTIASVVVTDADITGPVVVDLTGFTASLTAPGTSPAIVLGAHVEQLTFKNGGAAAGTVNLGSADVANPNAGISGAGLSKIDAANFGGTLNLGILALIDGTNDDSTPVATPLNNDGLVPAFELTAGTGVTTATLGKDPDSANVPTLAAGSEWVFDYTVATGASRLTITDEVVFGTPALPGDPLPKLTLKNVDLVIQGDVDLTGVDLSGVNANSDIFVPAGNTLTMTYAQAAALLGGVDIMGEGTVKLVGEVDTDAAVTLDVSHIRTVGVDLSGLTNAGVIVPQANPVTVALTAAGALNDAVPQVAVGFHFTGSGFNDAVTGSNLDDILDGAAGNDSLTGGTGNDTFNVTAGTDAITDLVADGTQDDVLVVSVGATANATVAVEFTATADTVNSGTANLSTDADGATIDVSLAGGSFNLLGGLGADILIGSEQADVIVGGGNDQAANVFDTLTGNGGADVFRFTINTSTPQTLTAETVADGAPNAVGVDWERVDVTLGASAPGTITIPYSVNGAAIPASVTVNLLGAETQADVASAIAAAFITAGFSTALVNGGTSVEVRGANGNSLSLGLYDAGTTGTTGATGDATTNTDVAQVTRVQLGHDAAIVPGETYSLSLTLIGTATAIQLSYTAEFGDGYAQVTQGLEDAINALGLGAISAANGTDGTDYWLDITDVVENNGGFTVTGSSLGGFDGSSASDTNADLWNSSDVIVDFLSGTDKVDFQGLVAGSAANYAEAAQVADYATALTDAGTALNGTVRYYLTSVLDIDVGTAGNQTTGVLFFDADADGVVDGAVRLTGVSEANFAYTDITASPVPVI